MKIHPHSDSYPTIVNMVQVDRNTIPLLEGKGNFGQYTSRDLAPAASRYSEIKLAQISIDMMKNFEKGLVNFIDNYDGTIKIPEVLPVKFPTILTYAQSGIGVGFSSSIPSFNLIEICEAMIHYIKTGEYSILIPDFATGGYILNDAAAFEQINKSGTGSIKIRGKAHIEGNEIIITEIPYGATRENIIEKIVELAGSKLKEVVNVIDETGLKGMAISIDAKKGTDMNLLLEKLYMFTPLQSNFSCNMNILINDLPKVLGVHEIIENWLKWRNECIKKELEYDIAKIKEKLHILEGYQKILTDIDAAIDIIRKTNEKVINAKLMKYFNIDFNQAHEIINMKLIDLNKDLLIRE
jgi:DNA gyrase subunit A